MVLHVFVIVWLAVRFMDTVPVYASAVEHESWFYMCEYVSACYFCWSRDNTGKKLTFEFEVHTMVNMKITSEM
jgi:hypothetical protein